MKIRSGFVSNSSSSSFVLFASKETIEEALSQMTEWEQAFIRQILSKPQKLGNDKFLSFGYTSDTGGNVSYEYCDLDIPEDVQMADDFDEDENSKYEIVEKFERLIPEEKRLTWSAYD